MSDFWTSYELPILGGPPHDETPSAAARRIERETLLIPLIKRQQLDAVLSGKAVPDLLTADERTTWAMLIGDLRTIDDQAQSRVSGVASEDADGRMPRSTANS